MSKHKKRISTVNISTKKGDNGFSSLINGDSLPKYHIYFETLGTLDELNSWIGLVLVYIDDELKNEKKILIKIQNYLFKIGAELALAQSISFDNRLTKEIEGHNKRLQHNLGDYLSNGFFHPGGTELAAHLDIARTVCRRCERRLVLLKKENNFPNIILQFINRLSDYLFLLRCYVNQSEGYSEIKAK